MSCCKHCNKILEHNNKTIKQTIYCSLSCQAKDRWLRIRSKIELEGCVENAKQARRYMLYKHGNVCSICHNDVWQGQPIPVVIDHIDGNPENNLLDNLRVVCCNCDAQLPTFKARNKGKGRAFRRQRYKEGKSY